MLTLSEYASVARRFYRALNLSSVTCFRRAKERSISQIVAVNSFFNGSWIQFNVFMLGAQINVLLFFCALVSGLGQPEASFLADRNVFTKPFEYTHPLLLEGMNFVHGV